MSLAEASNYCRRLARSHYENFTVASWFLPRRLRPHFYRVYAYCRWADDLADEADSPDESLRLLDWWQGELDDCYAGRVTHPVFVALHDTIQQFSIPRQPLADLLIAFRQDQRQTRYQTAADLLEYCRYSANPVGRLVLCLGGASTAENQRDSDAICTGLQLANFCQDVARDFDRGRIYLPAETFVQHGYDQRMFERREFNGAFRDALAAEVERAEACFRAGDSLVERLPGDLRLDVALFSAGGRAILNAIRNLGYNVWRTRPTVSKWTRGRLLWQCWRNLPTAKAPTRPLAEASHS